MKWAQKIGTCIRLLRRLPASCSLDTTIMIFAPLKGLYVSQIIFKVFLFSSSLYGVSKFIITMTLLNVSTKRCRHHLQIRADKNFLLISTRFFSMSIFHFHILQTLKSFPFRTLSNYFKFDNDFTKLGEESVICLVQICTSLGGHWNSFKEIPYSTTGF